MRKPYPVILSSPVILTPPRRGKNLSLYLLISLISLGQLLFAIPVENLQFTSVSTWSISADWTNQATCSYTVVLSSVNDFSSYISSETTLSDQNTTNFYNPPFNILPNTTYWLEVKVSTDTDSYITISTSTLCEAPSGLNWGTVGENSVVIQWSGTTKNPNNTTYVVEIAILDDFTPVIQSSTTTKVSGSVSFSQLNANTAYYGRIVAFNWNGRSASTVITQSTTTPLVEPGAITDLNATRGPTEGMITLTWTSPGDDGTTGQLITGSKFHIATTTVEGNALDNNYWNARGTTTPDVQISTYGVNPGNKQTYTLVGLKPNATYYIRIWTQDENVNNWSQISVGATTYAQVDVSPPGPITAISALAGFKHVTIQWTAPYEDDTPDPYNKGTSTITYSIKKATFSIDSQGVFDSVPAYFRIITGSNTTAGALETILVDGLTNNNTYWFAIVSSDEGSRDSIVSSTPSQKGIPFNSPPADPKPVEPDSSIGLVELKGAVTFYWLPVSPGFDGNYGDYISSYVLAISSTWAASDSDFKLTENVSYFYNISASTFDYKEQLVSSFVVTAGIFPFNENTTYYWQVRAIDSEGAAGGWSAFGEKYNRFAYNAQNESPNPFSLLHASGTRSAFASYPASTTIAVSSYSPTGFVPDKMWVKTPVLKWYNATDPDPNDYIASYRVYYSSTDNFSLILSSVGITNPEFTVQYDLIENATYSWWIGNSLAILKAFY